ncbi:ATP-dependent RNA helicase RhlE [Sphingomonas sp. BE270]|jgi:ATP-dependent RNA helicase RhlE|uniref:DEAD/DEAH box helicase n=1 Tax=unclassified Sphingomonas TaxID=196159 RepID=UPI000F87DE49|nr:MULTISPECIES: DEAD/DEAH box helicase [unclassified Sphingomonas]MDR6848748.1 ATP-dependent RNA helicase RhlE [Sphingomonas sp. BE137]MDR7256032.1 ATP-dependent RNA helicase RhlE [Sphingomonas sp. BE270]RUN77951.1 DEAD/DEAH box helicase [Sphingomonas sp. TF3]
MTFAQLGLAEPLVRALEAKGYTTPTPIQKQSIPILLEGGDLLGIAQTGTGKTAAFVLPSIQQLVNNEKRVLPTHCRMLVLAPTRELASQIAESAREYGKFSKMSVATVFGGTSINKNRQDMARGVDILVATPGRLLDLIEQRFVSLAMLEILVLDEADQMLDLGFIHALRKIVRMLPKQRQTLFFSATMPNAIRELANQFLNDPKTVKVAPTSSTAERVDQFVTFLNQGEKQALLTILLRDEKVERALVFTRTKHGADRVVKLLGANGIVSNAIHGNKSQPQRERALAEFKSGKAKVLVATDIAARGIDVSGVSHVFNFELPNVPEQYVHRIGRTARAGASGTAISFVADDERTYLRDIEKLTRVKPEMMQLPEGFTAEAARIKAARPAGSDTFERRDDSGRHRAPPKATHAARPTGDRSAGAGRPAGARPEGAGRPAGGGRPGGQGRPGGGYGRPAGGRPGGQGRPAGGGGRRSPAAG